MPVSYLARITECEHGFTKDVCGYPVIEGRDEDGGYLTDFCPGGTTTRIEPDYEAASKAYKREWVTWWDEGRAMSQLNWSEGEERVIRACVDAALGGTE
jgi:hypothetical protein